jgi:Ca-activated chloride channel homolog
MKFADPNILLLLLLIPGLVLFYIFVIAQKKAILKKFGDEQALQRLTGFSGVWQNVRAALLILTAAFCILSLARPQFGTRLVEVTQRGADVVIAVDVSRSMLAQDLKPNRLEKAKNLLGTLISELEGNRVGIVAFAGASFWQCPLTLDIAACHLFLQIMDANLIPLPGTSIGSAIRLATQTLEKTSTKSKAIILLTDGEDHDSDAVGAAEDAAGKNIRIFTIGFGNPAGEPVPVTDDAGNFTGYKKDKKGETVMSKLDESLLLKISDITKGVYFRADDGTISTDRLLYEIKGLDRGKLTSNLSRQYEDRYQYILFFALALLFAECLLPGVRGYFKSK